MRLLRSEKASGLALVGLVLLASGLGCSTRVLGYVVEPRPDGGGGGSAGDGGSGGRGGTGGDEGDGGGGSAGSAAGGSGGSAGACEISCGEGACPDRGGQPRVLVASPFNQQIGAIAVSADTLYWGTNPNASLGEVRSMPLAGGPSTLLVQGVIVSDLYLDGETLYVVTNDRFGASDLASVHTTGGSYRGIVSEPGIRYVTADASGIYYGAGSGSSRNRIMRANRTSFGVTPVVEVTGALWGFAVDDTSVYWASYANGGTLNRRSLAGGDITTLHASSAPITSPVLDGDDIVFVEGISTPDTCMSAVRSIAKAGGGTPRLLSPGTSGVDVWRPVRDATHLYWGRSGRDGAILRTVKGETPEILAGGQRSIGELILGPTDVFWIASTGSGYEVRTLPK